NGTAYYYKVAALNASGTSAETSEVSATPSASTGSMVLGINCGGSATGSWVADEDYNGGTANAVTNTITTTGITNPAPVAVYQTNRFGTSTYTVTGLTASTTYTVRLHFCETYWDAAGDREFNVSINSTQVLTNFDIWANSGGENVANIQQFSTTSNSSGQIVIVFTTTVDNAQINGIEIDSSSGGAPAAPTGLTATGSFAQIALSWAASSGATSYNVYRGTASGGESATAIATGITTTSYTNTGLPNATTYYYKVAAVSSAGTSSLSSEAGAATQSPVIQINTGGSGTGSWVADTDYSGGMATSVTSTITTTGLVNPAPQAVYQCNRYDVMTYTIGSLTANGTYTVRLHFCETYFTAAGDREFNVSINGTQVLTNFDIYATAGGENVGTIQQFTATANSSGQILIAFSLGAVNEPQINGIEILH
ncbi:MAG: malectin domain-containing carbohydrate-binding protein, partial [Capsulimonadaceae bacterium]